MTGFQGEERCSVSSELPVQPRTMRILFDYRPSAENAGCNWRAVLPAHVTLERIDETLAQSLQRDLVAAGNAPWFDHIWGGIDRFLQLGFGYAVVHEGSVVSNCRTHSVNAGVAAIQVSTRYAYRRQGLAFVTCRAFLEHCSAHGLQPEYSCLEENAASVALALRLGFVQVGKTHDDEG